MISGRVVSSEGRGIKNARVTLVDGNGNTRNSTTNSFGFFRFEDVRAGESYVVSVTAKNLRFESQLVNVGDTITDLYLMASP